MKKFLLCFLAVTAAVAMAGCDDDNFVEHPGISYDEQTRVYSTWRVATISGSLPYYNMSASYTYSEDSRLKKAEMSEQNTYQEWVTSYEECFEWLSNRPVRQSTLRIHTDGFDGNNYRHESETLYRYDSQGRLLPRERLNWENHNQNYAYDDFGRLIQTYRYEWEGITYADRLEWDNRGNVVRHIFAGPNTFEDKTKIYTFCNNNGFSMIFHHPNPRFIRAFAFQ